MRALAPSTPTELRSRAARLIDRALSDYGPGSEAYADVLTGYVEAPPGGREALFLELAWRLVGVSPPIQSPYPDSPATSARVQTGATDPAVADLARALMAAIRSQVGS